MTAGHELRDQASRLREAAMILRVQRFARPRSFSLRVACRVLERAAGRLDDRAGKDSERSS